MGKGGGESKESLPNRLAIVDGHCGSQQAEDDDLLSVEVSKAEAYHCAQDGLE